MPASRKTPRSDAVAQFTPVSGAQDARSPRPGARFERARWHADRSRPSAGVVGGRFAPRAVRDEADDRADAVGQAIAAAKAGDAEAIRFLYLRYAGNVYGYVLSMVRDEHEAEDVTQQVFLKLIRVIGKYEPREVPFAAWILRVARNAALDHLRQRRLVPCEDVFGADDRADDTHHDRRRDLRDALGSLPEDQRNVVVLRHLVGLSPGEIAELIGRSDASVHGLHHRGRAALRGELERLEAAPAVA